MTIKKVRPLVAMVVPSLEEGGGVPAVAEFVYQVIRRTGRFDVILVSLSTTALDDVGISLTLPGTWLRSKKVESGLWRNRPYVRVGVLGSELEFQRYKPRKALTDLLAGCDLIQVAARPLGLTR